METKFNKNSIIGNRRVLVTASAVVVVSILLLAGFGFILSAHADTNNESRHAQATGTFTTQRSYINGPPFPTIAAPYGLTIVDYNVVSTSYDNKGAVTGKANAINTLAIDSSGMGRITGYGTFWGTVGDSAPGLYSFISTITIDTTVAPAPTTGNLVIVQGSGQGGLTGICGTETFTGTVNLATGAGSFTYDLEAQFGSSCHSEG
jgi:hypothetical protein